MRRWASAVHGICRMTLEQCQREQKKKRRSDPMIVRVAFVIGTLREDKQDFEVIALLLHRKALRLAGVLRKCHRILVDRAVVSELVRGQGRGGAEGLVAS